MPHRLLLADDSVTIQRVIELTFADEDVQVTAVGDGRQAIDRIGTERPDIVLADVGMPGCDGYEVAAFIKQTPELAHIPVLLLTGAFEPVDEARAAEAGVDGVLAKPFEPQHLIARVKELLGARAPVAVESAPTKPPAEPVEPFPPTEVGGPDALPGATPAPAGTPALDFGLAVPEPGPDAGSLDEYFDRLDAAFATLGGPPPSDEGGPEPAAAPPWEAGAIPLGEQVPPTAPVAPFAFAPEPPAGERGAPPIADVFGALLEAERSGDAAAAVPPAPAALSATAAPSDSLVDQVASRVIERLADRAVRETVVELVSAVAERLVREEIERLKARGAGRG